MVTTTLADASIVVKQLRVSQMINLRKNRAMNMHSVRRRNLRAVIAERANGSVADFSRLTGISESRLSQVLSETYRQGDNFGEKAARTIEEQAGLPRLFLDKAAEGAPFVSNVAPGPEIRGLVPLISWVRAGMFCETADPFQPGDADRWLPCPVQHGPNTFCLRVVGSSMDGEGGYTEGEIIFVDPDDSDPRPNKDFIIKQPDGTATFKRLKQEPDGWYLLALNPEWQPRYAKMPEGAHICGRVIYSARDR